MLDCRSLVRSNYCLLLRTALCVHSIEQNNGCRTARGPKGDTDDDEESAKVVGITIMRPSHHLAYFFGANSRSTTLKMVRDVGKCKHPNTQTDRHQCFPQKSEPSIFWKNCLENDIEEDHVFCSHKWIVNRTR